MKDKLQSRIGLCQRAGKLVAGDEGVLKAVRSQEAKLVIVATDASDNTRKKYRDKCNSYEVPLIEVLDRYTLGHCTGKDLRVVVAVTDEGFARIIEESAKQNTEVDGIE
ncbi:YlxQ family RNA-binding protein [Marinicrinis sediminis]|uniref:YlxQ family RNA-binding protein n=1 Tax=Marinicrinis sediminis TaxID=1652465 RepID=A0ABW5R645_9BACL